MVYGVEKIKFANIATFYVSDVANLMAEVGRSPAVLERVEDVAEALARHFAGEK